MNFFVTRTMEEFDNDGLPMAEAQGVSCPITTSTREDQEDRGMGGGGAISGRRKEGRRNTQKKSLGEVKLPVAREKSLRDLKRKVNTAGLTEEDKKEDRRAANRLSAFQSRQRRKMIIDELQKTVADQSDHNADQAKQIVALKRQLQDARRENEILRSQLSPLPFPADHNPFLGAAGQFMLNPAQLLMAQQFNTQQQQRSNLQQNALLQNALRLYQAQQEGQPNLSSLMKAVESSTCQYSENGNVPGRNGGKKTRGESRSGGA